MICLGFIDRIATPVEVFSFRSSGVNLSVTTWIAGFIYGLQICITMRAIRFTFVVIALVAHVVGFNVTAAALNMTQQHVETETVFCTCVM